MKVKKYIEDDYDKILAKGKAEFNGNFYVVDHKQTSIKRGLFKKVTQHEVILAAWEDEDKEELISTAIEEYERVNINTANNRKANDVAAELIEEKISELNMALRKIDLKMDNIDSKKNYPLAVQALEQTLKNQDTDSDTINKIIREVSLTLTQDEQNNESIVTNFAKNRIESMCNKAQSIASAKTRKRKITIFLGCTGVGKTSTVSKLATILNSDSSSKRSSRVGVISLDVFKEGGIEQLKNICGYTNIPVLVANNFTTFEEALLSFEDKEYVFIDTAGRSQYNIQDIRKVEDILGKYIDLIDEIYLVMSATTKFRDMLDIYESYNWFNINRVIFSKLDETQKYGNIISFIDYHPEVHLSYVTTGQSIPADIELIRHNTISDRIFNGYSNNSLI